MEKDSVHFLIKSKKRLKNWLMKIANFFFGNQLKKSKVMSRK